MDNLKNYNSIYSLIKLKNEWSETQLIFGKFIGNFFYHSKPKHQFHLIWRPDRIDHSYGEYIRSYKSFRSAEQAMLGLKWNSRFTIINNTNKYTSHFIIGDTK